MNIFKRYRRKDSVIVIICFLSLIVAGAAYKVLRDKELFVHRENFINRADRGFKYIELECNHSLSIVGLLNAFFDASEDVSRDEFEIFTRDLLKEYPFIKALEWVPRVKKNERFSFEQDARRDGMENYEFLYRKDDNELYRIEEKSEYFPVYYIEPYSGYEGILGYDLSSDSELYSEMRSSWVTGKSLVVADNFESGFNALKEFLIITPVYDRKSASFIPSGREEGLKGFILGFLNFISLIDDSFRHNEFPGIDFHLYDITDGTDSASFIMSINGSDGEKSTDWSEKKLLNVSDKLSMSNNRIYSMPSSSVKENGLLLLFQMKIFLVNILHINLLLYLYLLFLLAGCFPFYSTVRSKKDR